MDLISLVLFVLFLFQQLAITKQSLFLKPCKESNIDCRHSITGLICNNQENRCNCPDGSKVYGYENYPRIGSWNEVIKNCYLKVGSSCELKKKYDNLRYYNYECDPDAKCYPVSKDKEEGLGICSRTDPSSSSALGSTYKVWILLLISVFIAAIQFKV